MTEKDKAIELIKHHLPNGELTNDTFAFAKRSAMLAAEYTADQIAIHGGAPKTRIYYWSTVANWIKKITINDFKTPNR